jgi:hypothetical protein
VERGRDLWRWSREKRGGEDLRVMGKSFQGGGASNLNRRREEDWGGGPVGLAVKREGGSVACRTRLKASSTDTVEDVTGGVRACGPLWADWHGPGLMNSILSELIQKI